MGPDYIYASPIETQAKESVWLFADATHTIYDQAKRRVYVAGVASDPARPADATQGLMVPVLEPNPKWTLLENVLQEIRQQQELMHGQAEATLTEEPEASKVLLEAAKAPILLVARDCAAVNQLRGAQPCVLNY